MSVSNDVAESRPFVSLNTYIGLIGLILVTHILVRVQQGNKTIIILEETFYFFLNIPICSVVEVLQLLTLS